MIIQVRKNVWLHHFITHIIHRSIRNPIRTLPSWHGEWPSSEETPKQKLLLMTIKVRKNDWLHHFITHIIHRSIRNPIRTHHSWHGEWPFSEETPKQKLLLIMTFFWSVQVIWDNFCFDASLEKFHSPSQEGGVIITSWWICGWHWWENGGEWGFCGMYKSFEKIFGCHLSTKNLMFPL